MAILTVEDLTVRIPTDDGVVEAARGVSFEVEAGELFGIAGESGSGKSVLTQAITGLIPSADVAGRVLFEGCDLIGLPERRMRALRGAKIGMVFQDPLSSLHPYYPIGAQVAEVIHAHERVSARRARHRAIDLLERVGIAAADLRYDDYPHQFSGGMRQRVMIAMALVLNPPLVIADEPTTALDVTIQQQILALLDEMRRERGTTVIMITHDLSLLASIADHVMVMYAGRAMEIAAAPMLFAEPLHPYTAGLLASSPANARPGTDLVPIPGRPPSLITPPEGCAFRARCATAEARCAVPPPLRRHDDGSRSLCWRTRPAESAPAPVGIPAAAAGPSAPPSTRRDDPAGGARSRRTGDGTAVRRTGDPAGADGALVQVRDLRLAYRRGGLLQGRRTVDVLKGIDLDVRAGETLGLVGESGCGKSTLARVIAGLVRPSGGLVRFDGEDVARLDPRRWRSLRRRVQLVFQDPFGSLNPRRRVSSIIGDPLRIHGLADADGRRRAVRALMERVGLNPEHYNRFPQEFSGGQRQRIGIARALALEPDLIIFDEPVSALDVSIQAQILNLMGELQRDLGLTYLFISHDLSVVRHVCDRIAVMNAGRIVDLADTESLFERPADPYTRALIAASVRAPRQAPPRSRRLLEPSPGARP